MASSTTVRPGEARYRAIERYIRSLVERGQPGDALPTEAELCARFSVSRMTVRQALTELSNDGLVERRRGQGTFVSSRPVHRRPGLFLSFSEEMERRGAIASSRVLAIGVERARPVEVDDLGLRPGASVLRIVRVRYADGVPVALEDAAVLDSYADVAEHDLSDGSLHTALRERGVTASRAVGTITARLARAQEVQLLDLPPQAALLVEVRILFDQQGEVFERTETRYVADRYVIDVVHTHP